MYLIFISANQTAVCSVGRETEYNLSLKLGTGMRIEYSPGISTQI
jgi:hypothetical protein